MYSTTRSRVCKRRVALGYCRLRYITRFCESFVAGIPSETKTVEFTLGPKELSYLNREMRRVVEAGAFEVMAGGNSVDLIGTNLNIVNR